MSFLKNAIVIGLMGACSVTFAAQASKEVTKNITQKLTSIDINVTAVNTSPVNGLYEVLTNSGVYYVSEDAQFLVHGTIYDLKNDMKNLTEASFSKIKLAKLKSFESEMIVYPASNEKHVVTVFTDTSCGYCKKLHAEMADYNRLGITVRYLAFPRGGIRSNAYHEMVSIWCAENRNEAMHNSKIGKGIIPKTCKNTVKEQYELGLFFGVNGTPALVLEDGSLQPGYVPAARLIGILDSRFPAKK
ncbi:MAG TPA: bifunctional protein-disulfide isomerase/oxidoreductase DsbC [Psychromonas hadalis]|nr:bifunctional protein-disulfide isomerase/oxidoreductase DsbC [Psychromonas hadalis]